MKNSRPVSDRPHRHLVILARKSGCVRSVEGMHGAAAPFRGRGAHTAWRLEPQPLRRFRGGKPASPASTERCPPPMSLPHPESTAVIFIQRAVGAVPQCAAPSQNAEPLKGDAISTSRFDGPSTNNPPAPPVKAPALPPKPSAPPAFHSAKPPSRRCPAQRHPQESRRIALIHLD